MVRHDNILSAVDLAEAQACVSGGVDINAGPITFNTMMSIIRVFAYATNFPNNSVNC